MSASEQSVRRPMSRGAMRLAIGGSALLVVAGLGAFWYAARSRPAEDVSGQIAVTVNDAACEPMALSVPAGRTSFRITNASDRPLEWEILDGVMVVAERENIAPGFNSVLTERLKPGVYDITCGLLSNPRGRLEVVPTAELLAAVAQPEMRAFIGPLSEYRVYLSRRSSQLIDAIAVLSDRIAAGDVEGARTAWLETRQPWRQMAPVSGRIGDLANRMDPLAAYLAGREDDPAFTGLHRIEQGLWQAGSTAGLEPVVAQLADDAATLKERLRATDLAPADLAGNAADLAARVADQASGSQTPYSHSELAEFSADLDGIEKSASLVEPLVSVAEPAVSAGFEKAVADARTTLDGFRVEGAFPPYDEVDAAGRQKIAAAFTAVAAAAGALNPAIGLE